LGEVYFLFGEVYFLFEDYFLFGEVYYGYLLIDIYPSSLISAILPLIVALKLSYLFDE